MVDEARNGPGISLASNDDGEGTDLKPPHLHSTVEPQKSSYFFISEVRRDIFDRCAFPLALINKADNQACKLCILEAFLILT